MSKKLVAYFSASGVTKKVAEQLSQVAGADLFEIRPAVPYTDADLNWTDTHSRSSVEMNDPHSRPKIAEMLSTMADYDVIFLGFPIWWYTAPTIIHTFLESYDFSGKTVIPFATSGGSGMGRTVDVLKGVCPVARFLPGKRLDSDASAEEVTAWVKSLGV